MEKIVNTTSINACYYFHVKRIKVEAPNAKRTIKSPIGGRERKNEGAKLLLLFPFPPAVSLGLHRQRPICPKTLMSESGIRSQSSCAAL